MVLYVEGCEPAATWTKIRFRIGVGLESIIVECGTPDSSCAGLTCGADNSLGRVCRNHDSNPRTH